MLAYFYFQDAAYLRLVLSKDNASL